MAGEQRGSPGHKIKDYGKITKTKGGVGVAALGSPLRVTRGNMDEDLYHEELLFLIPRNYQRLSRKQPRPLPDPGPTYLVCGSIFSGDCSAIQA